MLVPTLSSLCNGLAPLAPSCSSTQYVHLVACLPKGAHWLLENYEQACFAMHAVRVIELPCPASSPLSRLQAASSEAAALNYNDHRRIIEGLCALTEGSRLPKVDDCIVKLEILSGHLSSGRNRPTTGHSGPDAHHIIPSYMPAPTYTTPSTTSPTKASHQLPTATAAAAPISNPLLPLHPTPPKFSPEAHQSEDAAVHSPPATTGTGLQSTQQHRHAPSKQSTSVVRKAEAVRAATSSVESRRDSNIGITQSQAALIATQQQSRKRATHKGAARVAEEAGASNLRKPKKGQRVDESSSSAPLEAGVGREKEEEREEATQRRQEEVSSLPPDSNGSSSAVSDAEAHVGPNGASSLQGQNKDGELSCLPR